ncbi:MAG: hypothetical protein ACWGQW_13170 [bacterium]
MQEEVVYTEDKFEPPEVKRFMYVRCSYPECYGILTKEQRDRGVCQCGLNKFRGVPLGAGKLTPEEEQLFEKGLVHLINVGAVAPDPDLLNLDNDAYWERVAKEFNRQRARARRRKAEKKRGDLEKWLKEQERLSGLNIKGIIEEAKSFDRRGRL